MSPDIEKNRARVEELKVRLKELSASSQNAFPELLFGIERNCHSAKAIYVAEEGDDHILLSGTGELMRCELHMYPWLLIPSYVLREQDQSGKDQDYDKHGQNAYSILSARTRLD